MAYSAVADSGRDYDGDNGFRPPDGHLNSGNEELRKKLGSVEHGSNVDSPDQVKELVDIIEAAEVTIRTQVEETEQLRNSLRAVELELQKIDEQKQSAHEGYNSSQSSHGRNRSVLVPSGLPQPYDYQNGSAQHNGISNDGRYGGHNHMSSEIHNRSNGASAADNGLSISPLQRRRHSVAEFRQDAFQPGQVLPAELQDSNNPNGYQRSHFTGYDSEVGQDSRRRGVESQPLEKPAYGGFSEDIDPLPGIVGLRIVGDAVLGGRLTTCGHSINGTSLCIFQWVRHYQEGTAAMIEGAAQPEYTITANDCDSMVAIECVPMDERGRRGDLVTVMANDGNWISRDPMMQDQINTSIINGHASFEVNLLDSGYGSAIFPSFS